jgi:hypothetical protein
MAITGRWRIDRADIFTPCTSMLATLTDDEEIRYYRQQHRYQIDLELRALAKLEFLESSGYNDGSRAAELAEKREAAETRSAEMQAETLRLAERLEREDAEARHERFVGAAAAKVEEQFKRGDAAAQR